FYIGNNAAADGGYRPVAGIRPTIDGQQYDAREVAGRALGHPVSDREASSYFYREGFAWIASAPGAATRLYLRKLALPFNRAFVALNDSYPFFAYDARTLLALLPVGAWLLMPLGLCGLIFSVLSGPPAPRTSALAPRPSPLAPRAMLVVFTAAYAATTAAF